MKQSCYVEHAVADDGVHLLYSTAKGAFAVLGEGAFSVYDSLAREGASEADEDAEVLETLCNLGFVVDDDADELAAQYDVYRTAQQDLSTFVLVLAPTYACNLRCPYCYEKANAASWDTMGADVEDAVYAFVEEMYRRDHFTGLDVEWYGGEPSLVLDIVERMSKHLMAWCDGHDLAYTSMMLTNGTNIEEEQAALIARCGITAVLLTVDGPEEIHNMRRPVVDGRNSYQAIMRAAEALRAQGITMYSGMNLDKNNAPFLDDLQRKLAEEHGIYLLPALLNDYHEEFGHGAFTSENFDLFTHEEYAEAACDRFLGEHHGSADFRAMLAPAPMFCRGQLEDYYGIDAHGDVYKCDGWMGDGEHVLFNLMDDYDVQDLHTAPLYPFDDEECRACSLLPICRGTCQWERECCGYPHYPLMTTMDRYLRGWYAACLEEGRIDPGEGISADQIIVIESAAPVMSAAFAPPAAPAAFGANAESAGSAASADSGGEG